MEDKYIACMVLHAVGDTVGFKNGEWEFKNTPLEKMYEFIDLGGVNSISLKNWRVSDDTIMHMRTAEVFIERIDNINMNKLGQKLKQSYIKALEQFNNEGHSYRQPGTATIKYLNRLNDGAEWNTTPYDEIAGGAGAAMRSLCVGLVYYGIDNRAKLIQTAIEESRITHNSAIGYLGGMTSALFTALSIEKVNINNWPFILLNLFETEIIFKYIKLSNRGHDTHIADAHIFIDRWKRYVEDKFDENRQPIKRKSTINLIYRNKYYNEIFGNTKPESSRNPLPEHSGLIGSDGSDSVIIAYDSLIDSSGNWEKLVIYSMLHAGDTDTTGSIAAGLYGATYGFEGVPKNFLENLEYKNELFNLGKKLYVEYYK